LSAGEGLRAQAAGLDEQSEAVTKQGEQVELQRHQLTDQQKANRKQAEVLDLQAQELQASRPAPVRGWRSSVALKRAAASTGL